MVPNDTIQQRPMCAVERANKIMITAKVTCPPTWTREYYGYLMSELTANDHFRTSYECVDVDAEARPGSAGDIDGALFYPAEVTISEPLTSAWTWMLKHVLAVRGTLMVLCSILLRQFIMATTVLHMRMEQS